MTGNHHKAHPSVYVHKDKLPFNKTIPASALKTKTDMFLYELTEALRQNGCTLIGHIKGFVNAKDKGHLMFSITSFKEGPRFKGEITGTISSAILTVNIIVYGIGQKNIETIFKKAFDKHFK